MVKLAISNVADCTSVIDLGSVFRAYIVVQNIVVEVAEDVDASRDLGLRFDTQMSEQPFRGT